MSPAAKSVSKWKIPYLVDTILDPCQLDIPFFGITETWLKSYITDAQVDIPNYYILRSDRSGRTRGGAALYIQQCLLSADVETFDDSFCEAVMCTIESINMVIACMYRPPDATSSSFRNCLKALQSYIDSRTTDIQPMITLMGDFNLPDIDWEVGGLTLHDSGSATENNAQLLLDFMNLNLLSQFVTTTTRSSGTGTENTLDLYISNYSEDIHRVSTQKTPLSDHDIVSVVMSCSIPASYDISSKIPPSGFRKLDYFKADYTAMNAALLEIDWDLLYNMCDSLDDFSNLFHLTILQVCTIHAKLRDTSHRSPKSSPFVRQRSVLKRKKRKLRGRLSALISQGATESSSLVKSVKDDLAALELDIRDTIINHQRHRELRAIENIKQNPRYFYSFAKNAAKKKCSIGPLLNTDNSLTCDPKEMADILQQQYVSVFSTPDNPELDYTEPPLVTDTTFENFNFTQNDIEAAIDDISKFASGGDDDIPAFVLKECKTSVSYPIFLYWTESLKAGHISARYKSQLISPIHKKGSRGLAENYRPVSLTSHVIKIFERVFRKNLVSYLESNNLICDNQHGFRKGRSCLSQLLIHMDDILTSIQDGDSVDCIYLDFSKAFDKVDHNKLLSKVRQLGIKGRVYDWIKAFLYNRHQEVVVSGVKSELMQVLSGVPQGSVLGPILFLIYVNDMHKCVSHSTLRSFADDTRLSAKISCLKDCELLQHDLEKVVDWSRSNNMVLHEKKFELLQHEQTHNSVTELLYELPFVRYEVENVYNTSHMILEPSHLVRDLGISVSKNLSWSPHIAMISDGARKTAAWVLSVFQDRSAVVMLQLYKSLIRSKLEFSCPLWNPIKLPDIAKLESVQRSFTSKITTVSHLGYWDRLKSLGLMSLQRRRERYDMLYMWKILNGSVPNDLGITFKFNSRSGIKAVVPSLRHASTAASTNLFESSFHVRGCNLWNKLPAHINTATSLATFKSQLDTLIRQIPDQPPVAGYPTATSNSLVVHF